MIVWGGVNPSAPINTGAIYRLAQPTAMSFGLYAAQVGRYVYIQTVAVTLNVIVPQVRDLGTFFSISTHHQ
jgi:hypothetical protein